MHIAVISDIHGDLNSLRRVLTAIDRAATEQIWCLGDIGRARRDRAGRGRRPRSRSLRTRTRRQPRLLGHWPALAQHADRPRQHAQLQCSTVRSPTSSSHGSQRCPPRVGLTTSSSDMAAARTQSRAGSRSRQDAADYLARQQARIGLVGHTHRPRIAEHNDTTIDYDENPDRYDLADDRRAVLNPGAVLGSRRWLELDLAAGNAIWHTAWPVGQPRRCLRLRSLAARVPAGHQRPYRVAILDVHAGCVRGRQELLRRAASRRIAAALDHLFAPALDRVPGRLDGPVGRARLGVRRTAPRRLVLPGAVRTHLGRRAPSSESSWP
jgi:hypothetical protein